MTSELAEQTATHRLCDFRVIYICRGTDARRRNRLFTVSERRCQRGGAYRYEHRVLLRSIGRNEGHYLHTGCAILCVDLRLPCTGDFYFPPDDRKYCSSNRYRRDTADGSGEYLLDKLNGLSHELGFDAYTDGRKAKIDVFFITAALMIDTAALPHVIVRFYTVPRVAAARSSAGWALLFIAILYATAPAV